MQRTRLPGFADLTRATVVVLLMRVLASAQDVTEPALKAAFIYNFAKLTEWPPNAMPAAGPFSICVLGDTTVGEELERAVKTRVLGGRSITVFYVALTGPPRTCHVAYVSRVPARDAAQFIAGLRDMPILTISDIDGFTELGGIAQFFFEHGQLRFTINYESVKRARLKISARLLALSKRK